MNETTQANWGEEKLRSVPSGLRDLDRLLNGFRASDLLILAGAPSLVTALATSVAFDVARSHSVAFFSLRPEDHGNLVIASRQREGLCLHLNDTPSLSIAGLRTRARMLKDQVGLDLIIVDSLENLCKNEQVWTMTDMLRDIAKELNVPVIALSHPQFSGLHESLPIQSITDVEIFVSEAIDETVEVVITKQRNGPLGRFKLHFDGATGRFSNSAND